MLNIVRKLPQEEWDKLAYRFACFQHRFPEQNINSDVRVKFWTLSQYNTKFGTDFPGSDFVSEDL